MNAFSSPVLAPPPREQRRARLRKTSMHPHIQEHYRALLLEDDDVDAESVRRSLARSAEVFPNIAFEFRHRSTLEAGLTSLAEYAADAILLDLGLPDSDGLASLDRLIESHPQLPIVVLTMHGDEQLALEGMRRGADDYLVKDHLTPETLVRRLLYAIERGRRFAIEEALRIQENERQAAARVQQRLLLQTAPSFPGLDIACRCLPAEEVGGDLLAFLPQHEGRLRLMVADVTGHGLGPALIATGLRATVRAVASRCQELGEILDLANEAVAHDTDSDHFAAVFCAEIEPDTRRIQFSAAGHVAFLVTFEGEVRCLQSDDSLLGIQTGSRFGTCHGPRLRAGDMLVMPTDGIYEAAGRSSGVWGMKRLLETVVAHRHKSASEVIEAVFAAMRFHTGPVRPTDDCTLVIVKAEDSSGDEPTI